MVGVPMLTFPWIFFPFEMFAHELTMGSRWTKPFHWTFGSELRQEVEKSKMNILVRDEASLFVLYEKKKQHKSLPKNFESYFIIEFVLRDFYVGKHSRDKKLISSCDSVTSFSDRRQREKSTNATSQTFYNYPTILIWRSK